MNTRIISSALMLAMLLSLSACGGGDGGGGGGGTPAPNGGGTNPPGNTEQPAIDKMPDDFAFDPAEILDAHAGQHVYTSAKVDGFEGELLARVVDRKCSHSDLPLCPRTELSRNGEGNFADSVMLVAGDTLDVHMVVNSNAIIDETFEATIALGDGEDAKAALIKVVVGDHENPVLTMHFPPPASVTTIPVNQVLRVRGLVSDNNSIASVIVNEMEATLDQESGEWFIDYPIQSGDNLLEVIATDRHGNEAQALQTITRMDFINIPVGSGVAVQAEDAAIDRARNRLVIFGNNNVIYMDLATGERFALYQTLTGGDGVYDAANDQYLSGHWDGSKVLSFHPETSIVQDFSKRSDGKGPNQSMRAAALALDEASKTVYLMAGDFDAGDYKLWRINTETAERSVHGAESFGFTHRHAAKRSIAFDHAGERLMIAQGELRSLDTFGVASTVLVQESPTLRIDSVIASQDGSTVWALNGVRDSLVAIDIDTGDATPVTDLDDPALGPSPSGNPRLPKLLAVDEESGVMYVAERGSHEAIFAIDLETGKRVIVAGN